MSAASVDGFGDGRRCAGDGRRRTVRGRRWTATVTAGALCALVAACGGGNRVLPIGDGGAGVLTGWVTKGPVALATVTAYRLDAAFQRSTVLGAATTDAAGAFSMTLAPYAGHILLVAASGSYAEEATGTPVKLDGHELSAVVTDFVPTRQSGPVSVTPVSHWTAALASHLVTHEGQSVSAAMDEAATHLNAHFGALDWRTVRPSALAADGGMQLGEEDRAGLILAALSHEAQGIATRASVTFGVGLSTLDLLDALADDLQADGVFDGLGREGPLHLPANVPVLPPSAPASGTALDGYTVRGALAVCLRQALTDPNQASGLTVQDVVPLLDAIAANSDPRLFPSAGGGFDVASPVVSASAGPNVYTHDRSFTLYVQANDDNAGVAAVYAQWPGGPQVQGVLQPGDAGTGPATYALTFELPAPAHYPVSIWAVDAAGNSGAGSSSGLNLVLTYDAAPPQVWMDTTTPVYADERGAEQGNGPTGGMQLVVNLPSGGRGPGPYGTPVMPPEYTGLGPKVTPWPTGTFYKAATRLSWGASAGTAPPTASELRAQDPKTKNIPFLIYAVSYAAQTDAPIVSVTYDIVCASNCATPSHAPGPHTQGSLIPDPSAQASLLYLLPLTSETMPGLGQTWFLSGPTAFDVTVKVTDAAGNEAVTTPTRVVFHVLGPPVALVEDVAYPQAKDPHSPFAYSIEDGTYARLWDPAYGASFGASLGSGGTVRLVRYLLFNPESTLIAVQPTLTGGLQYAQERWDDEVQPFANPLDPLGSPDGLMSAPEFQYAYFWSDVSCSPKPGPCSQSPSTPGLWFRHSAGLGTPSGGFPALVQCSTTTPAPVSQQNGLTPSSASGMVAEMFLGPAPAGGEAGQPIMAGYSNFAVLPKAQGSSPGSLVLYLSRWHQEIRWVPLQWQVVNPVQGSRNRYEQYVEDVWGPAKASEVLRCTGAGTTTRHEFWGQRHVKVLKDSATELSGSLTLNTTGVGQRMVGDPRSALSLPFTRIIPHR